MEKQNNDQELSKEEKEDIYWRRKEKVPEIDVFKILSTILEVIFAIGMMVGYFSAPMEICVETMIRIGLSDIAAMGIFIFAWPIFLSIVMVLVIHFIIGPISKKLQKPFDQKAEEVRKRNEELRKAIFGK